ncbi:MAG: arginine--tRNA ligase [Candidatus Omnitrophica bacterium]|nr:arginine--tRNA ligase [Candidatus Omnitrophota bacterium]
MELDLQATIKELIQGALKELDNDLEPKDLVYLDFPTDNRFGELSTNIAMRLARTLKKSPAQIAGRLIPILEEKIKSQKLDIYIKDIKLEGAGFINFYFTDRFFYDRLSDLIVKGRDALRINLGHAAPVIIEFVSANPTGALSVAHARQAAVGDILANVMAFTGFKVNREYYLNDEGNQINILGESVVLRMKELAGERIEFPENYYQGDYIYDIAREVAGRRPQVVSPGDFAAGHILGIIKKELEDFGVKFDSWYSQKSLRESGKIDEALAFLKDKGFLYEEDGALWFKSTQFGDDKDRVVIKSDGSYTYLAPDIAYHRDKYKRGFKKIINLWGPDHHGYINRLKAAVLALGYDAGSISIIIVQLATISRGGQPVLMSTRRGQYITLREVLDEVGKDAARFFFLMRRTSSHLDFDLEVAKKQSSENPVYYCQYAYARIASILRSSSPVLKPGELDVRALQEKEELVLIKKIWQFNSILNICVITEDPYWLTVYLQELAETFHKFYDLHRVLGQDSRLTSARLALIQAVQTVLGTGLELLGVSRPESM